MAIGPDRAELLLSSVERSCGEVRDLLAIAGLTVVAGYGLHVCYRITRCLYDHFYGVIGLQERLKNYGEWAVVTGCTRGMGREFARQLAAEGINLVLMARNDQKLKETAEEIEALYSVSTVRIKVDFSQGRHVYADIQDALADKEIGILINNVGIMYDYPQYFHTLPDSTLWDLLNVNIASAQSLTHFLLYNCMVPRRRGLVVFMSSGACFRPTPQMSAYASTKKYVEYLAECLAAEMHHLNYKDIHIQTLTPMYVATGMTAYSRIIGSPFFLLSPDPATYVRHALWTLGRCRTSTGYWPHTVQLWGASVIPSSAWIWIANKLMTYFRSVALKERPPTGSGTLSTM